MIGAHEIVVWSHMVKITHRNEGNVANVTELSDDVPREFRGRGLPTGEKAISFREEVAFQLIEILGDGRRRKREIIPGTYEKKRKYKKMWLAVQADQCVRSFRT